MRVNCYTTTLRDGEEPNLVLLAMNGKKVEAQKYDGERYSIPTTLTLEDIAPDQLLVTHYYGLDEVRYEGASAVALGLWTGWPYLVIHLRRVRDSFAQRLFNRRTLEVRRRLDVLRDVLDATMAETDSVDALDLMTAKYGYRWAGHPGWAAHKTVLERHLEMLSQSGELEKVGHSFKPTGLALKTLEDAEDEDRKHSANLRVQLLLAVLTFVSAAMAAAQAGLLKLPTLLDLSSGPPSTTAVQCCVPTSAASAAAPVGSTSVRAIATPADAQPPASSASAGSRRPSP